MKQALDWTLLHSFLGVAETGSLSAAARRLGLSQPTLGRHIRDLETQLDVPLFTRVPRGLALTEAGADLLPHARAMQAAAAQLALVAAGRAEAVTGTVRITASRMVSHHILPSMLARLRILEPGIDIELAPSDTSENLLFREADIAMRMYRPTQLDVVTHHVTDIAIGLYGARSFLDRVGRPCSLDDLLALDFVGFDRSDLILRTMRTLGVERHREDFPVRCDDQVVHWNLVRAGCGLGGALCIIGDTDPTVERVAPDLALPALPLWLATPEPLRHNLRVRRVHDFLTDAFKSLPIPRPAP